MSTFNAVRGALFEYYFKPIAIALGILLLAGIVSRPLMLSGWKVVQAGQVELSLETVEETLGQGVVVGILGGFRTILADFMWIKLNMSWETRDRVQLDALMRMVTTLDPRPEYFWVNGARMIAYDVPVWRVREAGGYEALSEARVQAINQEQADQALSFLERARGFHPESHKLVLEIAQIYLNRLKDDAQAAEWFYRATQLPDAPYYAARLYAELLRKQGKLEEAYAYLKELYLGLPDDDPFALKDVVLERIQELETDLNIPLWNRFTKAPAR